MRQPRLQAVGAADAGRPMASDDGFARRCLQKAQQPSGGVADECAGLVRTSRLGPRGTLRFADGRVRFGVNFMCRDPLALAQQPAVQEAAHAAISEHGLIAGSPAALVGLTPPVLALESRLAAHLRMTSATVFASARQAVRDLMRLMLRPGDHAILAAGLPRAVLRGVAEAGAAQHRITADADDLAARLTLLRELHPRAEILVAFPAIDPDSGTLADLPAILDLVERAGAWLMVDASNDLGLVGPAGRGAAALWPLEGRIDLICGDFASVLAGEGGFVAARHPALQPALRVAAGQMRRAALSPLQAAAVHAALALAASPEGEAARARLRARRRSLIGALRDAGFAPEPRGLSDILVPLGPAEPARQLTTALQEAGIFLLLEDVDPPTPDSPPMAAWRLHVTAAHGMADIEDFVTALQKAHGMGRLR